MFGGEIRTRSFQEDADMNAHVHVKVNIPAEITDVVEPVLRVENGCHEPYSFSEDGDDPENPLFQDHRIDCSEDQHSYTEKAGQVAEKTVVCSRLAFRLLGYLGVGYRWITRVLALWLYAMFLMPGFMQVGYQYFFSKNIRRGIVYGNKPRNRLDLYAPEDVSSPKQVVIFITGGAWIIGLKTSSLHEWKLSCLNQLFVTYRTHGSSINSKMLRKVWNKAWGALLGIQLVERDVIVFCVDYRNFPQGTISDMVEDVSNGINFIIDNIDQFGGDPNRVYLAGQSAGSHIAACSLLKQAQTETQNKAGTMAWRSSQIKGFLGVSGGYNLPSLVDHFHERGLYRKIFLSVMEGEVSLPAYSPEMVIQSDEFSSTVLLLPPIYLFHGTGDYSIPSEASENFGSVLQQAGATVATKLYPDKTHTDVILQDPMRGGHDALFADFLAVLHADDEEARARDARAPLRPRLVPECLLYLAHLVSPF